MVFQINGYGQTEVSGMSGGAMEYEGLGEIFPGVELKVIIVLYRVVHLLEEKLQLTLQ